LVKKSQGSKNNMEGFFKKVQNRVTLSIDWHYLY
jgi:hypothetical protein